MNSIAIIGLGYVGLPLCLQFARSGAKVLGLDIDQKKVTACNTGQSYIKHISSESIQEQVTGGRFAASADLGRSRRWPGLRSRASLRRCPWVSPAQEENKWRAAMAVSD